MDEWMKKEGLRILKRNQPDEMETQGGSKLDYLARHLMGESYDRK